MDIGRPELYYYMCRDQVYDLDFDSVVVGKLSMDMNVYVNGVEVVVEESNKRRRWG